MPEVIDDGLGLTLGDLIDNNLDFFKNHIKGTDLGYCTSLKNLLAVTYNELVDRKNGVIQKLKEFKKLEDDESVEGSSILVQQIYVKLQSIEEKYNYISTYIVMKTKEVNKSGN